MKNANHFSEELIKYSFKMRKNLRGEKVNRKSSSALQNCCHFMISKIKYKVQQQKKVSKVSCCQISEIMHLFFNSSSRRDWENFFLTLVIFFSFVYQFLYKRNMWHRSQHYYKDLEWQQQHVNKQMLSALMLFKSRI